MKYAESYSQVVQGVRAEQVWAVWSRIDLRSTWDDDTEWAKINGAFVAGNVFWFKPKGGPKLKMRISEAIQNKSFTDSFRLPGATLHGIHDIIVCQEGLEIRTTMQIDGCLAWLWKRLLVNGIVASLPRQTELLIQQARLQR